MEKSDNDDKFISLLKAENEKLKKEERVITKVIYKDEDTNVNDLKREIEILRKKLKTMSKQAENRQVENREEASNQEIRETKQRKMENKEISV